MSYELNRAYRRGLRDGMIEMARMLAVWRNGVQVVSVQEEPLRDVIAEIMCEPRHDKYPGGEE